MSAAEHHLLRVVPDPAAIPVALLRTSIHARTVMLELETEGANIAACFLIEGE